MLKSSSGRRFRGWLLFALVLAVILRLYAAGTENRQSPDAYNYARQAETLRMQGLPALRDEAQRFVNDPAMLAVPPVTRTVFLGALAGWMKLTDTSGISSVAAFSCVLDIIAAALLALLALNVLGEGAAAVSVVLYAFSPIALSLARHGWSDTLGAVVCLLNLRLALRCLRSEGERWSQVAFAASLALTFGVKEAAFAQACLVFTVVLVLLVRRGRRGEALKIAGAFAVSMLLMVSWTAFAIGGFGRVAQMYGSARDTHAVVPYLVQYQNGSVSDWLQGLWLSDPVLCTLAVLGLLFIALRFRAVNTSTRDSLLICAVLCCVFPILPILGSQLYNVRYETPALAPACLLGAFALRELWQRLNARTAYRLPLAISTLVLCAGVSFWRYNTLIARPDLQDLSLKMILNGHN